MKSDQKRRAIQIVSALQTRGATVSVEPIVTLLQELIGAPEQAAGVPDWLETTRFLTDVTTAAGLLAYGKRDKGLAKRIGDFAFTHRMLAAAPEAPAVQSDLVKDAGRYRWLRAALSDRTKAGKSHYFCSISEGCPEELDEAIDAAIEQQGVE